MDIAYESFVDSEPFKFLVGLPPKTFYMHAGLAAKLSSTFATLVGGGMSEAKEKCAKLKDTDKDTFIRVIQFAYTGDYSVAEPDVVLSASDVGIENSSKHLNDKNHPVIPQNPIREPDAGQSPEEPPYDPHEEYAIEVPAEDPAIEEEPAEWVDWGSARNKKDKRKKLRSSKSKVEQLWDSFKSEAHVAEKRPWQPEVNEDHCQDYTPVFLCHAKLYAFADTYDVVPLQELVLQKLRLTLSRFKLHPQRVGDVVELLKYTYTNTTDYEESIDELRNLVTDYLVCHIEKIIHHVEFTKLLGDGDMVKDFLPKLVERRLD
ncbi:uncharacterized protein PV07_07441 [Cladophialophora immunda]|uniref:BTB domain-containing protein n=1 Tax=Cladophialophora immunda TaxID=569365 RepID=A0A0D1ZIE1_9EURO|nr:uncharacterized protein PV07_07441 [Cladophialophora immunda]KIW27731.1 hypothetical protein PV07_07441 [Cladophialophora immunda]OQV10039.1 hypothetical protein CLAIMM_14095 [Cladophialophora immunda]